MQRIEWPRTWLVNRPSKKSQSGSGFDGSVYGIGEALLHSPLQLVRKLVWQIFGYAVDGYKTLGFEICEQLGWTVPDAVVIPSGADLLWGAWKGFIEFHQAGYVDRTPRIIAAETFGPLKNALAKNLDYPEPVPFGPTVAISAGVPYSTYLFLKALRDSDGTAEEAGGDEAIMDMQLKLAALEGIYAEASSTQSLAVVKRMREDGRIGEHDRIVAVLTSSGLKHTAVTSKLLPPIPAVDADQQKVLQALQSVYGFTVRKQPTGMV